MVHQLGMMNGTPVRLIIILLFFFFLYLVTLHLYFILIDAQSPRLPIHPLAILFNINVFTTLKLINMHDRV